jgi:hypothetical protein
MDEKNDKDSVNCRKRDTKTSKRKLTYGIFSLLCQHHVCYGFHLMQTPEGRKDLFCVLYERYPTESLKSYVFIYYYYYFYYFNTFFINN